VLQTAEQDAYAAATPLDFAVAVPVSAVVTPLDVHDVVTQTFVRAAVMRMPGAAAQGALGVVTVLEADRVASAVCIPPVAALAPCAGTAHSALLPVAAAVTSPTEARGPVGIAAAVLLSWVETAPVHVMPAAQVVACWQSSLGTAVLAAAPSTAAV